MDAQQDRVSKVVSNWTGSSWVCTNNLRFVYDGWNLLAELNTTNGLLRSYTWGLDLSGTEQGAGGIGGLLFLRAPRPLGEGSGEGAYACAFDGNGSVTALVDLGTQALSAAYEYSPFGETIRATGQLAKTNPFRFSTKYRDDETGLLYYGYRYYQPSTGRWPSRDPIGERGGWNLYGFVVNEAITGFDPDGRIRCECGKNATAGLKATLDHAEALFWNAPWYKKVWGCYKMFYHPTFALYAWDLQFPVSLGTNDECKEGTVTVEGQCANEWDVNYALYGRGAKCCKLWFIQVKANIVLYKAVVKALHNLITGEWTTFYGTPESLIEFNPTVIGWAKYGYDGTVPIPDPAYQGCKLNAQQG